MARRTESLPKLKNADILFGMPVLSLVRNMLKHVQTLRVLIHGDILELPNNGRLSSSLICKSELRGQNLLKIIRSGWLNLDVNRN